MSGQPSLIKRWFSKSQLVGASSAATADFSFLHGGKCFIRKNSCGRYSDYKDCIEGVVLAKNADGDPELHLYKYNSSVQGNLGAEVTLTAKADATGGSSEILYDVNYDVETGKAVITLTGTATGTSKYVLVYSYDFAFTSKALANGWSGNVVNSATLTTESGLTKTGSTSTPLDADNVFEKTLTDSYNPDTNQISYMLNINQGAETLMTDGDGTLTVKDTLDYGAYTFAILILMSGTYADRKKRNK